MNCVVEARKVIDNGQTMDVEEAFTISDTCETQSISEYSQDKHAIDEDYYAVYLNSRSMQSLSGSDALRMALMRFCGQHGLEKDSWSFRAQS